MNFVGIGYSTLFIL